MPITILDVAKARGIKEKEDGSISCQAFHDVGLPFFGGCCACQSSIAAYNMYPSKNGYVMCRDCIGDYGFETVEEFNAFSDTEDEVA